MQLLNGKLNSNSVAEVDDDFDNDEKISQLIIPAAWCLNEMQLKFIQSIIEDGKAN